MRKEITLVVLFLCCGFLVSHSQNNVLGTKSALENAQDYYDIGEYKTALGFITEAEKSTLAVTGSLIYLKLKILYNMDSIGGGDHREDLMAAVDKFAKSGKSKFTPAQYAELTDLSATVKETIKKEKDDYDLAKKAGTLDAYNYFLSMHSNSKFAGEIKTLYSQLPWQPGQSAQVAAAPPAPTPVKAEKKKPEVKPEPPVAEKKAEVPPPVVKKKTPEEVKKPAETAAPKNPAGAGMIAGGAICLLGGAAMIVVGVESYMHPAKITTNTWALDNNVNIYKPITTTASDPNTALFAGMFAGGGALVVTGAVLIPLGAKYMSKSVKTKNDALKTAAVLTFYPSYQPGLYSPNVNFSLKF